VLQCVAVYHSALECVAVFDLHQILNMQYNCVAVSYSIVCCRPALVSLYAT